MNASFGPVPRALLLVGVISCGGDVASRDAGNSSNPAPTSEVVADSLPLLDSAFVRARDVYFGGEYDSAKTMLQDLLAQARDLAVVRVEAQALTWLGLAAWRLGDYGEARSLGEQALSLKLTNDLHDQTARSYNALGLLAWNENRLTAAARFYDQAITSANDADNVRAAGTAGGNLGLVHTELGNFSEAREAFTQMREVMRDLGEVRLEGNALTNLGMLEIRVGNPATALPLLAEARSLYASIDYSTGEQAALGQLGTAYTRLGEPGRAFAVLDSALAAAREQGLRQDEASDLEALAALYRDLGDFPRALGLYADAKEINAEMGLDVETAADLRDEAEIHLTLGDVIRAEAYTREALEIHRAADVPLEELRDLLMLAEIADRNGETHTARETLAAARTLADQLNARSARVELALTEARIADRRGQPRRVLGVIDETRAELVNGRYSSEWRAHLLEARAYSQLGELDSAVASGRRALAAVERVRGGMGSGMLRSAYVADKIEVYAELVSTLLRSGLPEEAFQVSDAARVRSVLSGISPGSRNQRRQAAVDLLAEGEELLREIDRLAESIDMIEMMPAEERTDEQAREVEQLASRLETARQEYETLLIRVAETDRRGAAILGGQLLDIAELRGALTDDQLLVEFLVLPEGRILVFALTKTDLQVVESSVELQNLVSRVRLVRDLIGRRDAELAEIRRLSAGLRELLLGAVERGGLLDGINRITFVPHDVLNYVPFAALWDAVAGRYLVQDFDIQIMPSAAALPALGARSDEGLTRVRGVAAAFAPLPEKLPASVEEVREVARALRGTDVFVGEDATEVQLRRALGERQLVHVATHGVLNAGSPMFSRLEVTRGSDHESADDGRLEVHEVLGVTVNASTVFLSGCETGVSGAWATDFARGEEYATLSQAFLYAGARNVIATLWAVEDAGAAAFARQFYDRLPDVAPGAALAEAQRAMLRDPEFDAPYHWAGYQLAGDGLDWESRQ